MNTETWFDFLDSTGAILARPLPLDCILDCSAPGPADAAVAYWLREIGFDADPAATREYLRSTGAWLDDELRDHDENLARLLWIVANDEAERLAEAAGSFRGTPRECIAYGWALEGAETGEGES